MTQADLIQQLGHTVGKPGILRLSRILKEQHFPLRDVIDITFHPDKVIGFRAAWLLENIFMKEPENYPDELEYIISRFKEISNPGCMRHYAKIIMHVSDAKAPKSILLKLRDIDLEPVVEQLFDWMIDPKVKIAVKDFAGKALFNLKHRYDWIAEELEGQLNIFLCDRSAGLRAGAKNILKLMK